MSSNSFPREIEVSEQNAGRYFEFLEMFFGRDFLDKRLTAVNTEVSQEKGTYLQYWVLPKNAFWLGVAEGRNFLETKAPFTGALTPNMELALEVAAKLLSLRDSMPGKKIDEYKDRLLGMGTISPILFELDVASHFWQMGYDIEWTLPPDGPGVKSAEFLVRRSGNVLEVECKTKSPDAGRSVRRRNFYRLVDTITQRITG